MGKITEYPIVNSIGDNDTLFVSKDGALSQIKKSDLDIGGGGGGIEKILDTTINISQKDVQTSGWASLLTFNFTTENDGDVLINIDNITWTPLASGATFDVLYFKMLIDGVEVLYTENIGYYNITSKSTLQCIKSLNSGTHSVSLVCVPKPSYVRINGSIANVKVYAL